MGLFDKSKKKKELIEKNFTLYGTNCTHEQFVSAIQKYFNQYELKYNNDFIETEIDGHEIVFNTNKSKDEEYYKQQSLGMCNFFSKTKIPIGIQKNEILKVISEYNSIFGICVKEEANSQTIIEKVNSIFLDIARELNLYILYPNMDIFSPQRQLLISYERATSEYHVSNAELNNLPENQKRRQISNEYIKLLGITCYENLPMIEDSSEVKLKDLDAICKRAIACLLSIQIVYDIKAGEYEQSKKIISDLLERYGVKDCLNSKEKKLFDGTYQEQDLIDLDWEYEAYWSLIWALGIIGDISDGSDVCDCDFAIKLVVESKTYENFKSKCNLRDINEVLDMLDLYYRYHWAVVDKQINPQTNTGALNSSVVVERRRGLEWLISNEEDWYDISLDT